MTAPSQDVLSVAEHISLSGVRRPGLAGAFPAPSGSAGLLAGQPAGSLVPPPPRALPTSQAASCSARPTALLAPSLSALHSAARSPLSAALAQAAARVRAALQPDGPARPAAAPRGPWSLCPVASCCFCCTSQLLSCHSSTETRARSVQPRAPHGLPPSGVHVFTVARGHPHSTNTVIAQEEPRPQSPEA